MAIFSFHRPTQCRDCKHCGSYYKRKKDGTMYRYASYRCHKKLIAISPKDLSCKEWEDKYEEEQV